MLLHAAVGHVVIRRLKYVVIDWNCARVLGLPETADRAIIVQARPRRAVRRRPNVRAFDLTELCGESSGEASEDEEVGVIADDEPGAPTPE
eukprot:1022436-Alexandrium_andersonii.AAC.1